MSNELTPQDKRGRDLTPALNQRGLSLDAFRVLRQVIWPSAKTDEVILLAYDYCKARQLDPMKKMVHIVPVWNSEKESLVDTIWPGIAEVRTTAMRTGAYAGRDVIAFGPDVTTTVGKAQVTFPEWAQCTVYRMVQGQRCAFVGDQVYWLESYATKKGSWDTSPNHQWSKRPRGMLAKVAEANALRIAFPEEAGDTTAEEMENQVVEVTQRLEAIEGEIETDLENLNKRLAAPKAEPRQSQPPAAKPNGERRPPSRTRLLAAALKLIERADSIEDLMEIEAEIEELPTGGGTRKTAREAWEQRLQELQPEPDTEPDSGPWVTLQEVDDRLRKTKMLEQLAEVEDLIGELSSAEDQVEAARLVRERAGQLNEREVAGDDD